MRPAINEEVPLFCLSSFAPRIPKVKGYEERCMPGVEITNTDNVYYSETMLEGAMLASRPSAF